MKASASTETPLYSLQPGETLLWEGQPDAKAQAFRRCLPVLILDVVALSIDAGLQMAQIGYVSFVLLTATAFVYTLALYFPHRPRYALSNRRVLLEYPMLHPKCGGLRIARTELYHKHLKVKLRGGRSYRTGSISLGVRAFALEHIANAADAYAHLVFSHVSTSPPNMAPLAFRRTRAVTQSLRPGEEILWRGKPDVAAYLRDEGIFPALGLATIIGVIGILQYLWITFFAAVGFIIFLLIKRFEALNTEYVITNQRIRLNSTECELASLVGTTSYRDSHGFGTIILETPLSYALGMVVDDCGEGLTFIAIPNLNEVLALMPPFQAPEPEIGETVWPPPPSAHRT